MMVGSGRGREKVRNMGERVGGSCQGGLMEEVVRQTANSGWRGICGRGCRAGGEGSEDRWAEVEGETGKGRRGR